MYVVWPEKINNVKVYHHNPVGNPTVPWNRGIVPENSCVYLRPLWDRQDCLYGNTLPDLRPPCISYCNNGKEEGVYIIRSL